MLTFDHPWAALALLLPVLVWLWLPAYRETMPAVRVPFFEEMAERSGLRPSEGAVVMRRNWVQRLLAPLCWALVVAALAKPVWVDPPIERTEPARDLMLAIDLSQSMEARDFARADGHRVDRLAAVKQVVNTFIDRRKEDRIGLIVFGAAAFRRRRSPWITAASRRCLPRCRLAWPARRRLSETPSGWACA